MSLRSEESGIWLLFFFSRNRQEDSDGKQIAVVLGLDGAVIAADQTAYNLQPQAMLFSGNLAVGESRYFGGAVFNIVAEPPFFTAPFQKDFATGRFRKTQAGFDGIVQGIADQSAQIHGIKPRIFRKVQEKTTIDVIAAGGMVFGI